MTVPEPGARREARLRWICSATSGSKPRVVRQLAYRLCQIYDREKRPEEAFAYNALSPSWEQAMELSRQEPQSPATTNLLRVGE